jgi:demethylmenaquinone methyltransferase/2-methoxy-6-polyprenyl-1,4-benzoquinol methylase
MQGTGMNRPDLTDFGFEQVPPEEKTRRVYGVFASVADNYDLMNDVMSLGVHRLWKRYAAALTRLPPDAKILDVAGGTGDMAKLYSSHIGPAGRIIVCDINLEMLAVGRGRLTDAGLCNNIVYIQADAETLPFAPESFDLVSIAFGLRNVTDKPRALASMYDKLKFGRSIIILEFSRVAVPLLREMYDRYSHQCIPLLGKYIAGDEASYRYLVESIRMHPDQQTLKTMMETAGFSRVEYFNLSGGIVAVHRGYKI